VKPLEIKVLTTDIHNNVAVLNPSYGDRQGILVCDLARLQY